MAVDSGLRTGNEKPAWTRWARGAFQVIVCGAVAWGIWRAVSQGADEFAKAGFKISDLSLGWLAAAGVAYVLGMVPACVFWNRVLLAMGQQPQWWETLVAYWIGHLGKYVPGKALVVVLRTAFVRSGRVDTTVAAVSVFVETLTLMAVGATLAAVLLAISFRHHLGLLALALVMAFGAGVPTLPPIFRTVVTWLRIRRANPKLDEAVAGLDWPLMLRGWCMMSVGWVAFGISLWAALNSVPNVVAPLTDLPRLTACVALAMVAGFLSLIPGGAGVRELVIYSLLEPAYGKVAALVAAATLRVTWLVTELLVAAMLYLADRGRRR